MDYMIIVNNTDSGVMELISQEEIDAYEVRNGGEPNTVFDVIHGILEERRVAVQKALAAKKVFPDE